MASAWLELFGVSGELTESGIGSTTWSEVGEELSSQAFSVHTPVMPRVAAIALVAVAENGFLPRTFLFSIFTNTSTLCTKIHFFEGKRL